MQVGLDLVTLALQIPASVPANEYYEFLYLTSSTYFQSAAVMGRRNTNSQPA